MIRWLLPTLALVGSCRPHEPGIVSASNLLQIEPVALALGTAGTAVGARVTSRSDPAVAICTAPVVKSATDSGSGQLLVELGEVVQRPSPPKEEPCPLGTALLLSNGDSTVVVDVIDTLDAKRLNLSVTLRYWLVAERRPLEIVRTFQAVPIR